MSAFSKFHPMSLMMFFVTVLAVSAFVQNPIISLIALLGATLTSALKGRDSVKRSVKFFLPLFFLVVLTNPLFSQNGSTILFIIGKLKVTVESVAYGGQLGAMLISIMLWCELYNDIMTEDKFLCVFGNAFPKISLVISTTLRYIPLLKRQAKKILRSHKALGIHNTQNRIMALKSSLAVFYSLISQSLELSIETSRSMKSRGYGKEKRTHYHDFSFKAHDALLICICLTFLFFVFWGSASGELNFDYYPTISHLNLSPVSVGSFVLYCIVALFPTAVEIYDRISWRRRRRNISING